MNLFHTFAAHCIQAVLKKTAHAVDDPNEKNYTGNEMTLKTLQT
jgi:hypothetical protein